MAKHQLTVDDELWDWAQQQAGPGKRPDHWLRQFLTTCQATGMTIARAAELPRDGGQVGYVGDVRVLRLRRDGESRCNRCNVYLTTTDLVIEQHYRKANGQRLTHYLHGWGCDPATVVNLRMNSA